MTNVEIPLMVEYNEIDVEADWNTWEKLEKEQRLSLEEGDFDHTFSCLDQMEKVKIPEWDDRHQHHIKLERDRAIRLKDPLNKDETFRELLSIEKFSSHTEMDFYESCNRHGIDVAYEPPFPVPFSSTSSHEESDEGDFVHAKCITDKVLGKLVELWRIQECLLLRLRVSEYDSCSTYFSRHEVAHYCRVDALPSILRNGLKLFSLSSSNDPTEGKTLGNFLQKHEINCNDLNNQTEHMLALQCSFSRKIDDLNLYRLYGKDSSGGEGTGLCLVFNMAYFDNQYADPVSTDTVVRRRHNEVTKQNDEYRWQTGDTSDYGDGKGIPLYWVLYYNSEKNQFYHTPCQRERWFYIDCETSEKRNYNFLYRQNLSNQRGIARLLKELLKIFRDLGHLESTELNATELGWHLCIYLRHLIKDAAFRDEQEARILKLHSFGDSEVESLHGKGSLSADYRSIFKEDCFSSLVKIIAGPKVKNIKNLRELLQHEIRSRGVLWSYGIGEEVVIQSDVPLA